MEKNKKNEFVCGIESTCPLAKELKHCPFDKFNDMNLDEIVDYMDQASNCDVHVLMGHYRKCIHLKEKEAKK